MSRAVRDGIWWRCTECGLRFATRRQAEHKTSQKENLEWAERRRLELMSANEPVYYAVAFIMKT